MLAAGLINGLEAHGLTMRTTPVLEISAVLDFIDDHQPQLVLLDFHVPPIGTSEVFFGPLTDRSISFAILTGHSDEVLWGRLLEGGARGVVSKGEPLEDVLEAIGALVRSEPFRPAAMERHRAAWHLERARRAERLAPFRTLTVREAAVLDALIDGDGPAEIAQRDFVAVSTIRSQLKSLYRKLQVRSQLEAVALARDAKWTSD